MSSIAFSPDGKTIATGAGASTYAPENDEGLLMLWSTANLSAGPIANVLAHRSGVQAVAWHPDGRRLATSGDEDTTVKIWDSEDIAAGPLWTTLGSGEHLKPIQAIAFSHAGTRLASGSSDTTVKLWRLEPTPRAHPSGGPAPRGSRACVFV